MALSDRDIQRELDAGRLVIEPYDRELLQAAGYTLRLGAKILVPSENQTIDLALGAQPEHTEHDLGTSGGFRLLPGGFVLGHTLERISVPLDLLGRVDGRSTMARIGLLPHQAAMNIWPGHGMAGDSSQPRSITLEVTNVGPHVIVLRPGVSIANFTLERLETAASAPYDLHGRYQSDHGVCAPVLQPLRDLRPSNEGN